VAPLRAQLAAADARSLAAEEENLLLHKDMLWAATKSGDAWMVRALLQHYPTWLPVDYAASYSGATLLYLASCDGHVRLVEMLLGKGADVNLACTVGGGTPLHIASQNGHVEVVKLLLHTGADGNKACGRSGDTPLYAAAWNGNVGVVEVLLGRGAEPDKSRTDTGGTPLYVASSMGLLGVVEAGAYIRSHFSST